MCVVLTKGGHKECQHWMWGEPRWLRKEETKVGSGRSWGNVRGLRWMQWGGEDDWFVIGRERREGGFPLVLVSIGCVWYEDMIEGGFSFALDKGMVERDVPEGIDRDQIVLVQEEREILRCFFSIHANGFVVPIGAGSVGSNDCVEVSDENRVRDWSEAGAEIAEVLFPYRTGNAGVWRVHAENRWWCELVRLVGEIHSE